MTVRTGHFRALLAAFAAALAVIMLALTPAAAMAHDLRESGSGIVICSAEGSRVVILGEDGSARTAPAKGFMGLKCSACAGPTLAVTLAAPVVAATPVDYVGITLPLVRGPFGVRGHARAPARPPGQGPPHILNV